MKKQTLMAGLMAFAATAPAVAQTEPLRFDPARFTTGELTMPDGQALKFKAYEDIFYVTNVEDSTYQTLNIYVPEVLADLTAVPILLRTYVGGYAASTAKTPSPADATGRALKEGYVVCIPGSRGNNSTIIRDGKTIYTGTAPNGLLDLKAAVRYLRYNDDLIPGSAELIFTDGTSAGGAMSALLGATGNAPEYEPYLRKMGAAPARDDVYAAICYCPITDLGHADMEYEWLYGCTNTGVRHLDDVQIRISDELAALCPDYINSLGLKKADGTPLTAQNYKDYIKSFLIASAHRALQEGCEIPDTIGFTLKSDFVTALDLDKYLSYVASVRSLKTPPAFDQLGVLIPYPSPENTLFGNEDGQPANFTDFSLRHRLADPAATISREMAQRVHLMNPMDFITTGKSTVAPNWYIRHGAKDRDTSFLVPINLATRLENAGKNVNFALPWNPPHSGDYNLDDLFTWLKTTLPR